MIGRNRTYLALGVGLLASQVLAQEVHREIRPSWIRPGEYEIYESGKKVGTVAPHFLDQDRYELKDLTGRKLGEVRRNWFRPEQLDVYDTTGRRTQEVRPSWMSPDRYTVRDLQSGKTGIVERDFLRPDTYRYRGPK